MKHFTSLSSLTTHTRMLMLTVIIVFFADVSRAQFRLFMGDSNLKYVLYDGVSCDDVRTSSLKSGKVSFDATNGIVTLDNVVYENTHGGSDGEFLRISYNGTTMMDFTIIVKGTNTITTYGTKA